MTIAKPFELPPFYRVLMGEDDRRLVYPIARILWVLGILIWLYIENHRQVSLFSMDQLAVAWGVVLLWSALSLALTVLYARIIHLKRQMCRGGVLYVLMGMDGVVLGLCVGSTGLTYSVALIPTVLFVVAVVFLGNWKTILIGLLTSAVAAGVGAAFAGMLVEPLTRADVAWGGGGLALITGVSFFLTTNLRRHGVAVVHDHMYQKWLEQLNTIIFDLMPAGAIVCDERGRIRRANPMIEPYVRGLIHRNGSILELDPQWEKNQREKKNSFHEVMGQEIVVRLTTLDNPDGRLFRVVFKPLVIHSDPSDALHLMLLYDITDVQRRQEEEELNRRWRSFQSISAGLVHEIRNPLGAIMGVVETILDSEDISQADKEKMLSMVRYEGARMNTLVQDFLDSLQSNMVLNKEKHDIKKICEDFYYLVSKDQRLKTKQIHMQLHNRLSGSPLIEVDKDRLIQVLHNLFQNALYAVSTSGDVNAGIIFELEEEGTGWVVIRLIDHGSGISPEVLQRVFDPFFTTKENGTGLGLSISYRIIDAHGGHLRLVSHPNRPTKAEVWLPR